MSATTYNIYGKINISNRAIAKFASKEAMECYGIVEMVSKSLPDRLIEIFTRDTSGRGIKVTATSDRITIDAYVIIKYGVSIKAVAESLKEAIKYRVEKFTGMIVETVNVNILGVKL